MSKMDKPKHRLRRRACVNPNTAHLARKHKAATVGTGKTSLSLYVCMPPVLLCKREKEFLGLFLHRLGPKNK